MAQVEPLPLVPATVITHGAGLIRFAFSPTALTRSNPRSIALVCNCSRYFSHVESEAVACGTVNPDMRNHSLVYK